MSSNSPDDVWPLDSAPQEPDKLLDAIDDIAPPDDEATKKKIDELKKEYKRAKKAVNNGDGEFGVADMPTSVLDGKLGELCDRYMLAGGKFPVAYAWPALLAVASALVPRYNEKQKLNIFAAIVGPIHSGKSQAIETAQSLLRIEPPVLLNVMAGSAEALLRKCKDAVGTPRLFSPDELGHLLEKSRIENASFPYILNRAFYQNKFEVLMGRKECAVFDASLSILGGLVENRFEDLFSQATTSGLYDRFMFGCSPAGYQFEYFPFETELDAPQLDAVAIHPDVWIEKQAWRLENSELEPRVCEIAIRAAAICASFDGRSTLRAADLAPARALAEYQARIRRFLKPNEGESNEGKIALKILAYLERLGGRFVARRKLIHDIGGYRYGPSLCDRALDILHANEDIEITTKQRPVLVRLIQDEGLTEGE